MTESPNLYTAKRGPVRVWQCDVCGELFEWADEPEAESYGSLRDLDDGNWDKIKIVCSAACKARMAAIEAKAGG